MRARVAFVAAVVVVACGSSPVAPPDAGPVDAGAPDVTPPLDAAPDTDACADGVKDGAETDVDCGGPACAKCADGSACVVEADCASQRCSGARCGTRAWFTESSGSNLAVPGTQTWTSAASSGLYLAPNLYAPSLVYLRWTGTLRFAGGGNGLCHVGQRFVIDDVPTGDVSWGNAIMVENGATRWHEMFTTSAAAQLGLGLHTISVEMTNANGFGTCYLDGDSGAAYEHSRLSVVAYDPKDAVFVSSTGEASAIATSTYVDIPGVSASLQLAAPRHVQISLAGTQYTAGAASGYCAYRLVIDGAPLGDATYGQALAVGDPATGWWGPVALDYGLDLAAGAHTIKAQLANPSTQATCYAGQGNNAYARFRMFVSQSPPGGLSSSVESTGGPDILGSSSAWTPVGLTTAFTVTAPTQAQVEMSAIQESVNGTSGHCSWRFVIDGAPLGDPNYGQAINVGSVATTWWTPSSLLWGQSFDAGNHTVSVEVRNSSNTGDCGTNGDALPYGRARLLVRVP